jgi:membrane fusion protein (multidrug efflux system)
MPRTKLNFLLVLVLLTLTAGCDNQKKDGAAAAGGPGGGMPPTEVGIITVKAQNIEQTDNLPGRTSAFQVAEIRPQVNGIILKRLFEEGGLVTAGQQLYQIDPATYQAAYDTAQATLKKAQANLASIKVKADRYKDLVALKAVSRQDYDDAVASFKSAEADIASAQAAVQQTQINLAYTKVLSPISGRIGKSSVTPGALVTENQTTALAVVTQLDPIYVDVTQSSADLLKLKERLAGGQLTASANDTVVDLMISDIGQKYAHPGKLKFSDVTVDPTTGSVQIRAEFPNPEGLLLPGLFVQAIIHEGQHDNALMVPQQAVNRDATGGASVMTVDADNKVVPAKITTGDAIGDQWVVLSGLQEGQHVIVQGWQKVQPGGKVKPSDLDVPAAAPAAAPATDAAPAQAAPGPDKASDAAAPTTTTAPAHADTAQPEPNNGGTEKPDAQ